MKEFNKIMYDILLKLNLENKSNNKFKINHALILKYFDVLKDAKSKEFMLFESYFTKIFHFCFELPLVNMIEGALKFRN